MIWKKSLKQRRVFFNKQLLRKKFYWIFKADIKLIEFSMIKENSTWINSCLTSKNSWIFSKNKDIRYLNHKTGHQKFMKSFLNSLREKNKNVKHILEILKIWYKKNYNSLILTSIEKLNLLKSLKELFKIRILMKNTGEKFS